MRVGGLGRLNVARVTEVSEVNSTGGLSSFFGLQILRSSLFWF